MLIGLFVVRLVPLHPTSSHATIEGYDSLPSADTIVFVGEGQVTVDTEAQAEARAEVDSAPLLSHEQEPPLYQVPIPPPGVELQERSVGDKDVLPDIHGMRLWLTPDFYLIFMIMGICG